MPWAEQWQVAVNYDRPVVFAIGANIALAGIDNDVDLESMTVYDKASGSVVRAKVGDDLGIQNVRDGIGLDDGALIVAYSLSSTTDGSYSVFDVNLHKVSESLAVASPVHVGTYQTYNGIGSFVPDLWTGIGGDGVEGLTVADWRFYRATDGIHLALIGLHVAESGDDRFVCLLDFQVSSSATVGTVVLSTSENPPADSDANATNIVVPWDSPTAVRVEGSGLEIVTAKTSRYAVSGGVITGVVDSALPIDPPTGDPEGFVAAVSSVGRARAFLFSDAS